MKNHHNIFEARDRKTPSQVYEDAMNASIAKKNKQGEALLPDEQKFIDDEEVRKEAAEHGRKELKLEQERLLMVQRKRIILELSTQFKQVSEKLLALKSEGYTSYELKPIEIQLNFEVRATAARAKISHEDTEKAEAVASGELAEGDIFPELNLRK